MTSARVSGRWVYAALAVYAAGFLAFRPTTLMIADEERYVSQAAAFAMGQHAIPGAETLFPASSDRGMVDYPPGTSLLQAPLVWAFGWQGAAVLSVLALVLATLATKRWLEASGRDPAFALIVPGFIGVALFGRVAMSDAPATAIVALTCLTVFRATEAAPWSSLAAGLLAGATLLFREPLVVLIGPLIAGALARRRIAVGPVIAGAVLSLLARFGLEWWLFGDAFHVRDPLYGFAPGNLRHGLPTYAFILLVLLPAGLALPAAYRAERRAELLAGAAAYVALFMLYGYDPVRENGTLNGLMLASRFMAPLTPLLAFMAADVWPRWFGRAHSAYPQLVLLPALCALGIAAAVHPLAASRERAVRPIVDVLQARTRPLVPVVTNTRVSLKYLSPVYGPRRLIQRYALPADSLVALQRRHGVLDVALLDRSEGTMFSAEVSDNAAFLRLAASRCRTLALLDTTVAGMRLHLERLEQCR